MPGVMSLPIGRNINIVSKKWTLLIINSLGNHQKLRFNELMKELEGVSPKTLSDTLKVLEREGLIKRETFKEIPPRVEYSLKNDGIQLRKTIIPLINWAAERKALARKNATQLMAKFQPNASKTQLFKRKSKIKISLN